MNGITDSQKLAQRFNEDEEVWQRYEHIRRLRFQLGTKSLLPDEVQDELDWIEAQRECQLARCVGERFLHGERSGPNRYRGVVLTSLGCAMRD